ncbi:MAG: PrsW family glutamic-type intramembrane protease [Candidatus Nealsonbacteria bacterium]|nr:PrsW family glutamic-type intramembrane protease [Candidatus Nealsonbacteria bacterium]
MLIIIPIIAGLAPSFIWLLFFLRKDSHPEPNKMILKIFGVGMIITVAAAFIEFYIEGITTIGMEFVKNSAFLSSIYPILFNFSFIFVILASAFIEEFAKYLVVKEAVLNDPAFDEPVDAMLYMIITALGFAAVENMLILLSLRSFFNETTIYIIGFRFLGATFLHALCSAAMGYFLALSLFEKKKRLILLLTGITIATLLHGAYNFSIMKAGDNTNYIFLTAGILIYLAFFVSLSFKKIKMKASTCKV